MIFMGENVWSTVDGTTCRASDVIMSVEHSYDKLRASRDSIMERYVDYYQSKPLLYNALTDSQKTELGEYRQALLDLPATVLAAEGNVVITDLPDFFPAQPSFMSSHPNGIIHT